MVFKKKKVPEMVDTMKEAEDSPPVAPNRAVFREEINPRVKEISKMLHAEYGSFFSASDAANAPSVVFQSEVLILLFAIYDELRTLRSVAEEE